VLTASVKAKLLAKMPAATDNADLNGLCEAIAEAILETIATGTVTYAPGLIVVAGSAATQTNAVPATGGAIT
jgi:hypothetical protein